MSLLIFCLKSVRMSKMSHSFMEKLYSIALPMLMNMPDWTYLLKGFWNATHKREFFDVKVFNPLAKSHLNHPYLLATARTKGAYEERI